MAQFPTFETFARQHKLERFMDVSETSYQAALTLGIVLLHQHEMTAENVFADAIVHCQVLIDKTQNLYKPWYVLATARVGNTVCDSCWVEKNMRIELLTPALTEFQHALEITSAPGIVQDTICDLKLIQAAGIEGLEPIFELLQSA